MNWIYIPQCRISNSIRASAPSLRGLLSGAKLREFIKTYKIDLTIPPPHVRSAPPFTQGRLNVRLCVNFNSYAVKCGITKLKRPLNLHKLRAFARRYNAHRGKPRPYFLPVHFPDVYPFLRRRKRILCNRKRRKL